MRRLLIVMTATLALLGVACGASGGESSSENEEPSTTEKAEGGSEQPATEVGVFGEMDEAVCGDGELTVDPEQAGGSPDVLRIGVPTDRSAQLRPGLNKEMWDASQAFADWCNEAGGIGGLQIELVDMDAALFDVEAAMTKACDSVFALVGGGLAQDQLMFSGNDGTDFHKCGLIDIPGFNNSGEKSNSNGQVQPIPNPGGSTANTWLADFAQLYPEEASNWVVMWGDLPSLESVKDRYEAAAADVDGIEVQPAISYPPIAVDDWTPYAERMKASGATSFSWVGEPGNMIAFLKAARIAGWEGRAVVETNMYDPSVTEAGSATEGVIVKTAFHPIEEADKWPAVQQYLDLVATVPDGKIGALGMQSISAWLLFATAANACGAANDNVIDRDCILTEAASVGEWTGGGLHSIQEPKRFDEAVASQCLMLLTVKDGEFVRLYPEIDGEDDDGDGFHCPKDGITEIPGGEKVGKVDPSRKI